MSNNGANLGFEQKLWSFADKLRSNMGAAELSERMKEEIRPRNREEFGEDWVEGVIRWKTIHQY